MALFIYLFLYSYETPLPTDIFLKTDPLLTLLTLIFGRFFIVIGIFPVSLS
ncbi:MAG: hypothetical protein Q8O36_03290 [Candidatus Omnitrophota bacterium]|nr:hypothetical protein [Candidatus Omnitrophota bacterium]